MTIIRGVSIVVEFMKSIKPRNDCSRIYMAWLTVIVYLCHKLLRICSTCRNHFPVLSSFMTYHDHELPTLPDHLSSPPVFSGVRVSSSTSYEFTYTRIYNFPQTTKIDIDEFRSLLSVMIFINCAL